MLIEIAIGDAYGAAFEFADREFIEKNNDGKKYHERVSKWGSIMGRGRYTDDTQMTLAIAEHLIARRKHTYEEYVTCFLKAYDRDKRNGYSKRIVAALENSKDSNEFYKLLDSNSDSNGCVMRTVPLGILKDPKDVIKASIVHASTTHSTIDSIRSTIFISLISHYYYWKYDNTLEDFLKNNMGDINDILRSWDIGMSIPVDAKITASAVYHLINSCNTMTEILVKGVNMGGDVDSLCSISLGIASLMPNIKNDLDQQLYDDLENEAFGKDYILKLENMI